MPWELYHVEEDFSQSHNLAEQQPEKVAELTKLFFAEASKYSVLPLDDRKTERLNVDNRPSLTQGRKKFTYPNFLRLPEGAATDLKHKNHTIMASVVIPESGAEGMLITQGGRFAGYGLFVRDGKLNLPLQPGRREALQRAIGKPASNRQSDFESGLQIGCGQTVRRRHGNALRQRQADRPGPRGAKHPQPCHSRRDIGHRF